VPVPFGSVAVNDISGIFGRPNVMLLEALGPPYLPAHAANIAAASATESPANFPDIKPPREW
jgi:hypothetical protein